jgi:glycosyltransferase involved in cell wall biosynthesis
MENDLTASKKGVSIIIPCFNDGRFLNDAIQSIYGQGTNLPFEIIIVDDASTDSLTIHEIKRICGQYDQAEYIRLPHNSGPSVARNEGLKIAKYDYIFCLDVDNKLSIDPVLICHQRGYLDRSVKLLSQDPDIVFVYCSFGRFEAKTWSKPFEPFNEKQNLYAHQVDTCAIYRRKEALAAGGYNQNLPYSGEDADFSIAMINHRYKQNRLAKVEVIRDPLFLYRVRQDKTNLCAQRRVSRHSKYQRMIERSPEIYQKHFPNIPIEKMPEEMARQKDIYNRHKNIRLALSPSTWLKAGKRTKIILKEQFGSAVFARVKQPRAMLMAVRRSAARFPHSP